MNSVSTLQKNSVRFRARSFVAFALAPEAPLAEWLQGLDRWTQNSPGFFAGRPVVLDLKNIEPTVAAVRQLVAQLAERGIRVYAIEGKMCESLGPDLPPLLIGAKPSIVDEQHPKLDIDAKAASPAAADESQNSGSLILKSPIRSGQSIFHPHGDVIVLGSVGSGSEIVAGGSVHVYGTLRGRVFAGATGNRESRIFCQANEAELLAVDGWYLTADDMEPASRGRPTQAFLDNGVVHVAALN